MSTERLKKVRERVYELAGLETSVELDEFIRLRYEENLPICLIVKSLKEYLRYEK